MCIIVHELFLSPQDLTGSELYTPAASLLHPVIYTTAVILLLCLLAVIISYMYHHRWESVPDHYRSVHLDRRTLFHFCKGTMVPLQIKDAYHRLYTGLHSCPSGICRVMTWDSRANFSPEEFSHSSSTLLRTFSPFHFAGVPGSEDGSVCWRLGWWAQDQEGLKEDVFVICRGPCRGISR